MIKNQGVKKNYILSYRGTIITYQSQMYFKNWPKKYFFK